MNSKTPVSLLQEVVVQRKESHPDYIEVPSDISQYSFKCIVKTGSTLAAGYGSSKKEAKHNSAAAALKLLGVKIDTNSNNNMIIPLILPTFRENQWGTNYIGKLNEYANTNAKSYPEYQEDLLSFNGYFRVRCKWLMWEVEGCGSSKKSAKQDAAKKMLQRIDVDKPVFQAMAISEAKQEKVDKLAKEALKKFEQLSMKHPVAPPTVGHLEATRPEVASLDELRRELKRIGRGTELVYIQAQPYILALKVTDTDNVVMGQGTTKEEALSDLFISASTMFSYGFTFTNSFSS